MKGIFTGGALQISAQEHRRGQPVGQPGDRIAVDVEPGRTGPGGVQRLGLMTPGEPVQPVPVLQCRIGSHQRSGFGTVEVGRAEVILRHHERLAENTGRHETAGNIRPQGNRRFLEVAAGIRPAFCQRGGVVVIQMIIHQVEPVANHAQVAVFKAVDAGQQNV